MNNLWCFWDISRPHSTHMATTQHCRFCMRQNSKCHLKNILFILDLALINTGIRGENFTWKTSEEFHNSRRNWNGKIKYCLSFWSERVQRYIAYSTSSLSPTRSVNALSGTISTRYRNTHSWSNNSWKLFASVQPIKQFNINQVKIINFWNLIINLSFQMHTRRRFEIHSHDCLPIPHIIHTRRWLAVVSSLQLLTRPATATLSLPRHNTQYLLQYLLCNVSHFNFNRVRHARDVVSFSHLPHIVAPLSYDENVGFKIQFWHHRISTAGRTRAPLRESRNFRNPIYSHVDFSRAVSTTNVGEWWDQSIACWFYAILRTACERWKNASEDVST